MFVSDAVIAKIEDAFASLDFNKPKAHTVYYQMSQEIESWLTDITHVSWHEFRFYALGVEVGMQNEKIHTIPPIVEQKEMKESK